MITNRYAAESALYTKAALAERDGLEARLARADARFAAKEREAAGRRGLVSRFVGALCWGR